MCDYVGDYAVIRMEEAEDLLKTLEYRETEMRKISARLETATKLLENLHKIMVKNPTYFRKPDRDRLRIFLDEK